MRISLIGLYRMHSNVTPNIANDRNPKTFEVGLSASANFTKLADAYGEKGFWTKGNPTLSATA
jgi:hypothetical protein